MSNEKQRLPHLQTRVFTASVLATRRARRVIAVCVRIGCAITASLTLLAAIASAATAEPLEITSFTMTTTQASGSNAKEYEPSFFTQAGGHPFALTSALSFSTEQVGNERVPTRDPRQMVIDLPTGLVADPQAVVQCAGSQTKCPTDSQVGVFVLHASTGALLGPIMELEPPPGDVAELGLETPYGLRLQLIGKMVRTPKGYGISLVANGLPTGFGVSGMEMTLWGTPAAEGHNPQRGLTCTIRSEAGSAWSCEGGNLASGDEPIPYLTLPSDCKDGSPTAVAWLDSWEEPLRYAQSTASLAQPIGCNRLSFYSELELAPESRLAEAPTGVDVGVKFAQTSGEVTDAAPPARSVTVMLPAGMSINPAASEGREACADGPEGIGLPTGLTASGQPLAPYETGEGEAVGPSEEPQLAAGRCPESSAVGNAQAVSPMLAHPLEGRVYLARPSCGAAGQSACEPSDAAEGDLYRIYIELGARGARYAQSGIVKLEGQIDANPATGQLSMRLQGLPQLPISQLEIELWGGRGALLTNPATCGPATTTAELEPWSAPETPDANASSYYDVDGCTDPAPLHPTMLAGSYNVSAASPTSFSVAISRADREQNISAVQVQTPLGLTAMLSSVSPCAEPAASSGECEGESRIGESTVTIGSGSEPLPLKGAVYLTGPYQGAPFGLSIVTAAVSGSLNLGRIVLRASVALDPHTAALTITTDPLPQILLGVPLRIRGIALDLDRPGFIMNPTNCEPEAISATVLGAQGTIATVSNPFSLADCANLAFAPSLQANTDASSGNSTGGASLDVKLAFQKAAHDKEADLARIKLALPRQLPSRLAALQMACPARTFNANPAACPSTSVAGIAEASTQVLDTKLVGPVLWIAHGREAFPSAAVVLQGDGVTVELTGSTVIEKSGRVRVAFESVPDLPLQSFQIYLPAGPNSILTTNTDLCKLRRTITVTHTVKERVDGHLVRRTIRTRSHSHVTLAMPVELAAHNGAVIHRTVAVSLTGCSEASGRTARRSQRRAR